MMPPPRLSAGQSRAHSLLVSGWVQTLGGSSYEMAHIRLPPSASPSPLPSSCLPPPFLRFASFLCAICSSRIAFTCNAHRRVSNLRRMSGSVLDSNPRKLTASGSPRPDGDDERVQRGFVGGGGGAAAARGAGHAGSGKPRTVGNASTSRVTWVCCTCIRRQTHVGHMNVQQTLAGQTHVGLAAIALHVQQMRLAWLQLQG
jgi:hypothetical protein